MICKWQMYSTVLLLSLMAASPVFGQPGVAYDIAFPNAAHHEAEVRVTFTGVPMGGPLEARMSRTSPGRYALHEFAKNVYNVRAVDGGGQALSVRRVAPHGWAVDGHDGTVTLAYTLFADRADGTYSAIDPTHAHLNMPATFLWARGMEAAPVRVTFHPPDPGWRIATQLFPTDDPSVFTAPDLAYFLDSPTEVSDFALRTWPVTSGDERYTIRLALHHDGTEAEVDAFAEMAEQVVAEQIAVFGEAPNFEPGTYTFIACYLPHVDGDGMEHRNSTILTSTRPLATGALRNLGTVAHEFFHAWNVERIRPRTLEPFDFEGANMSDVLWFAEGFTSYYTGLTLRRTGLWDDSTYAASLSGTLDAVLNSPGRQFFSPAEMSQHALFVDRASFVDPTNTRNTFISYYTWGSAVGLGLDLTLRTRFGRTLDGFMRTLWTRFGVPEEPYTLAELRATLADFTGDSAFAADFFARYIEGREVVDYAALLNEAGFVLRQAKPEAVWLGASVEANEDGETVVAETPLMGSPLYVAGIDRGDVLLAIGTVKIESPAYVEAMQSVQQPGAVSSVRFRQRGVERIAKLTWTASPQIEVVPFEALGRPLPDAAQTRRADWLGTKTAE